MARKVFFIFDHRDIWRANVVRNSSFVDAVLPTGFHDTTVWEEANREGQDKLRALIDRALDGTSVSIVLIGAQTSKRPYVSYEIDRSIAHGNALLGIRIEKIKDMRGDIDAPGSIPDSLARVQAPIFEWQYGHLGDWIEDAYRQKHHGA